MSSPIDRNADHSKQNIPSRPSNPAPSLQTQTSTLQTSSSNPNFNITLNPNSPTRTHSSKSSFYRSVSNSSKKDLELQQVLAAGPKKKKSIPAFQSLSDIGMLLNNSSTSSIKSLKGERVDWGSDNGENSVAGKEKDTTNKNNTKAETPTSYSPIYADHNKHGHGHSNLSQSDFRSRDRTKSEPSNNIQKKDRKSLISSLFCGSDVKNYSDHKKKQKNVQNDSNQNQNLNVGKGNGIGSATSSHVTPSIQVTLSTSASLSNLKDSFKSIHPVASLHSLKKSGADQIEDMEILHGSNEETSAPQAHLGGLGGLRKAKSTSNLSEFESTPGQDLELHEHQGNEMTPKTLSSAFPHSLNDSKGFNEYPEQMKDPVLTPRQKVASPGSEPNLSTPTDPTRKVSMEHHRVLLGSTSAGASSTFSSSSSYSSPSVRSQIQARVLSFNERQSISYSSPSRHSKSKKGQEECDSPSKGAAKKDEIKLGVKEKTRDGDVNGKSLDHVGENGTQTMTLPIPIDRPSSRTDRSYSFSSSYGTAEDIASLSELKCEEKEVEIEQPPGSLSQVNSGGEKSLHQGESYFPEFKSDNKSDLDQTPKQTSTPPGSTSHSHRASDATSDVSNATAGEPMGELINDFPLNDINDSISSFSRYGNGATFEIVEVEVGEGEEEEGSSSRNQYRSSGMIFRTIKAEDGSERLQKLKVRDQTRVNLTSSQGENVARIINPNFLMSPEMDQKLSRSNTLATLRSSKSCSELSSYSITWTDNVSDLGEASVDRNSLSSSVGNYNSVGDGNVNRGTFGFPSFINATSSVQRNFSSKSDRSDLSSRHDRRRLAGLGGSYGSLKSFMSPNEGEGSDLTSWHGNMNRSTLARIGGNLAILEADEEEEEDEVAGKREQPLENQSEEFNRNESQITANDQLDSSARDQLDTMKTIPKNKESKELARSESEATIRHFSQSTLDEKISSPRLSMSARQKNLKKLSIQPFGVEKENFIHDPLAETHLEFQREFGHAKSSPIYKSSSTNNILRSTSMRRVPKPLTLVATPTSARSLSYIGNENSRSQSPLPSGMVAFQDRSNRSISPALSSPARRISYVSPGKSGTNQGMGCERNFSKPTHISSSHSSPLVSDFRGLKSSSSLMTPSMNDHPSSDAEDSNLISKSSNSSPVKKARRVGMVTPSPTSSTSGNAFLQGLSRNGIERSRTPSPSPIAASFQDSDFHSSHGRLELEGQKEIAESLRSWKDSSRINNMLETAANTSRRFERREISNTLTSSSSSPTTPIKRFSTHLPYHNSSSPSEVDGQPVLGSKDEDAQRAALGTSRRSSWVKETGHYGDLSSQVEPNVWKGVDDSGEDISGSLVDEQSEDDESYVLRKGHFQTLSPSLSSPMRLSASQVRLPSSPGGSVPHSPVRSQPNKSDLSQMKPSASSPLPETWLSPRPQPKFPGQSTLGSPIGMRRQDRFSMASDYSQNTNFSLDNRSSFQSNSSFAPPPNPPPAAPLPPAPSHSTRDSSTAAINKGPLRSLSMIETGPKEKFWGQRELIGDKEDPNKEEGRPSFQIEYYEDESDKTSSKAGPRTSSNPRHSISFSASSGEASQLSPPNPSFHAFEYQSLHSPDGSKMSFDSNRYNESSKSPGATSVASFNFEAGIAALDPIRSSMFPGNEYLEMDFKSTEVEGSSDGGDERSQDEEEIDGEESTNGQDSDLNHSSNNQIERDTGKGKGKEGGRIDRDGFF